MANRSGPLSHIRVLDLGRIMAAPWATQIFADLGAEVIKVERPGCGDDTRSWGPPFLKDADGNDTGESGYFLSVNRGKRSIAVDIAKPKGQEILRRIADTVDVVIENFKVGALERYGLDAKTLRKRRPELVYCSVTGFGQTGPRADQGAYDFAIQAMGGLMSVTGESDDRTGGGPQKVGIPIIDLTTGMYAAVAILAALQRRAVSGEGETIDLAMLDVSAALLANQGMNHLVSGNTPKRRGNRHPNIQPQDLFACRDGKFVLAVGNDSQFNKLCRVLKRDWAEDARFSTNAARVGANAELTDLLSEAFSDWTRANLLEALDEAGVPAAPINTIPEFLSDPQIAHRRMVRELRHPLSGSVKVIGSPMVFKEAPLHLEHAPPLLGADTRDVLSDVGVTEREMKEFLQQGIIG